MSHAQVKHDFKQERNAPVTPVISADQLAGLELNRQLARGQARSQPGALVRGLSHGDLIL